MIMKPKLKNFDAVRMLFWILLLLELSVLCYIWLDVFVFEKIGDRHFVI